MDMNLLRTSVEVISTGSFAAASGKLFITQSAVSLRIQKLEADLGQTLFIRSKRGTKLTPAGHEFQRFAFGIIKLWEEGRQQIALPEGFSKSLVLGAEHSLWPRLGFRWLDALQQSMPDLSLRAELGAPQRLTRFLTEGVVQTTLSYTPQLRPGLNAEKVMEDQLVMVASYPDAQLDVLAKQYVFVDWGSEFVQAHIMHLPALSHTGLTFGLGSLVLNYMLHRQAVAYVPARAAAPYISKELLHLVPDAPRFPFPIYHVWREDLDDELKYLMRQTLRSVINSTSQKQAEIMEQLVSVSSTFNVPTLGEHHIPLHQD